MYCRWSLMMSPWLVFMAWRRIGFLKFKLRFLIKGCSKADLKESIWSLTIVAILLYRGCFYITGLSNRNLSKAKGHTGTIELTQQSLSDSHQNSHRPELINPLLTTRHNYQTKGIFPYFLTQPCNYSHLTTTSWQSLLCCPAPHSLAVYSINFYLLCSAPQVNSILSLNTSPHPIRTHHIT